MTKWLTLNRSAVCLVGHTTPYHSNRLPSLRIWQASTCQWPYGMEYQIVEESALVGWKSSFLNPVDGRVRVWRSRNTIFQQEHIVGTTAFGRNLALLRRLLTVRLLMRPLTIHRLRSMFVVLNGCCLASLLRSLSSLGVICRDLSVLGVLLHSQNDETGFYKFTCTFAKLKFGGGFKPVSTRAAQVQL
jgi:hypothetical protein